MEKRLYETNVVFNGALEDDAIEAQVTRVTDYIAQNGGEIEAQDRIGRRRLVYPIKKRTNGYYLGVRFKANTDLVQRMEKMFVLEEQILRYLTLAIDEKLLRARAASAQRMEQRQKEAAAAAEAAAASGIPLPPPERQRSDRHFSR